MGNDIDGIIDLSGLTNGEYKMGNTTSSINNDGHKPKRRYDFCQLIFFLNVEKTV